MRSNTRSGFTLIELMVAMALTMLVMVILSQAFVLAMDTFSGVKGIGDMQQNLRTAAVLLRDDLSQDHFEGSRRLGDPLIVIDKPQAGFFAIRQGSASVDEGDDGNTPGVRSYRAIDHFLYFTVKRRGNRPQNFFTTALSGGQVEMNAFFSQQTGYSIAPTDLASASFVPTYPPQVPAWVNGTNYSANDYVSSSGLIYVCTAATNSVAPPTPPATSNANWTLANLTAYYSSQWAEVLYFLFPTGSTEEPNNPSSTFGTPTYGLYRAQFVLPPDGTNLNKVFTTTSTPAYTAANLIALNPAANPTFSGLSCNLVPNATAPTSLTFYSPTDAASGQRVFPNVNSIDTNRLSPAATLVLPNVLSFQVQVMQSGGSGFGDVPNAGTTGLVYDTTQFGAAAATYNNKFAVQAIQITLRVWDHKTRQTRQITIVQDM